MYYENTYRVGARDVDPFNQCRPSSMMDFLQEAATEAAVELHVSGRKWWRAIMCSGCWRGSGIAWTDRSAGMRGSQSEPGTGGAGGRLCIGISTF